MHRDDVPITTPCGADWSDMTAVDARARLCASCNKVVHDLSAMDERDVRRTVSAGPVCVRYLYDAHGRVLFGAPEGATVVPASALLSKAARNKWLRAAALAATAIVFEACGGNDGGYGRTAPAAEDGGARDPDLEPGPDADADAAAPRVPADAAVVDAADAGADGDAN